MATHDATTIFGDLEDAILERLSNISVRSFDIDDKPEGVVCPALNVGVFGASFKEATLNGRRYRADIDTYVTLLVANPRNEKARRRDVYPLVMAAASQLIGWKPVLTDAEIGAVPLGVRQLVLKRMTKTLESGARMAFTLQVSGRYTFEAPTAEAAQLLVINMQFHLKSGDDTADAAATVSLGE